MVERNRTSDRSRRRQGSASTQLRSAAIAFLGLACLGSTPQSCRALSFSVRLPLTASKSSSSTTRSRLRLAYSVASEERRETTDVTDAEISSLLQDLRRQHDLLQQESLAEGLQTESKQQDDDETQTERCRSLSPPKDDDEAAVAVESKTPQEQAIINARWLLLGAAALYGTNFSLVKLLGQAHLPVGASSTLRFGMAALATSPWLLPLFQDKDSTTSNASLSSFALTERQWRAARMGFEVGVYNAIGYVAQAVGLETTAASKSAFLCSLAVVVVPLLDFMAGKQISQRQMTGTLMAIIGVAVLELGDVFNSGTFHLASGDLASLLQPICFGLGFWKMEKCMQQHPEEANRSTAAQLLAVFLGSWIYSSIAEPGALSMEHATEWISQPQVLFGLFWTGCITTALTVYMETLALKTLSAAETTLIFSTEPIWGTIFASLVMGEQLGIDSAMGAVLILSGCVFSNLGIDGIKELLSLPKKTVARNGSTYADTGASKTLPGAAASNDGSTTVTQLHQLRTGVLATFGGLAGLLSGLWTNVAIGTTVLAMDMEDVVDEIMNKVDL